MRYDDIPGYQEFEDLLLVKSHHLDFIDPSSSYVVFFDGKNVVKSHNKDMFGSHGFTFQMMNAARLLLNEYNLECRLFAIMDEITFIFPSGKELQEVLGEDNEDCVLSLLLLKFHMIFSRYDDCLFKGVCYPFNRKDDDRLIAFRKLCGRYSAMEYYAKEFLPPYCYINKTPGVILDAFHEHGLYEEYMSLDQFRNGLEYYRYKGELYKPFLLKHTPAISLDYVFD